MGVEEENILNSGPPSNLEEGLKSLQITSEAGKTETNTDAASTIAADGSQIDDVPRAEATEAVTDSDRVAATGNLKIRSKRTERLKRKMLKKTTKKAGSQTHLFHLPNEVLNNIMSFLLPSDLFRLSRSCRELHHFIQHNEAFLSREIIAARYPILEKCFRLPVPLDEVNPEVHSRLQHPRRVEALAIHRRYQHIPVADYHHICTCLTCVIRWNALCNVVDFSYWQTNLDKGDPIPMMPRGEKTPEWNQHLIAQTNEIVSRALGSPLLHACILESHLKNTTAAIKRQSENKGNKRRRFQMTQTDINSQTDEFLGREGPVTTDLPFHRDNYYMLEAMLPSRTWLKDEQRWVYIPAEMHERDLEWVATRWQVPV
ncbi:F-box domain-containing protein [Colletotrichum truncatum]|uniref:F-box domain-containing protein n=1 Tax=Colletotrichum truncatum TaxID=5467 RepID=A0ACC3YVW3_COLTU|nr:F-box domain-containing protein [Colletotrichum truncatum]KAF6791317.1 F-box domain-containing protein [Colletotrichum truncatum]